MGRIKATHGTLVNFLDAIPKELNGRRQHGDWTEAGLCWMQVHVLPKRGKARASPRPTIPVQQRVMGGLLPGLFNMEFSMQHSEAKTRADAGSRKRLVAFGSGTIRGTGRQLA